MTRTQLIQSIINRFGYGSYLEIGCANDHNFNQINIAKKIGVDPGQGGTHRMSSDDFFANNTIMFDIVFIDGLHISDQVDRDIDNALKFLNPNGTIVMHDCNPAVEEAQRQYVVISDWNGDVWKSFVKVRGKPDVDAIVGNFDHGCGVLRVRPNLQQITIDESQLTWDNLVINRQAWLRLVSFNEIMGWL